MKTLELKPESSYSSSLWDLRGRDVEYKEFNVMSDDTGVWPDVLDSGCEEPTACPE